LKDHISKALSQKLKSEIDDQKLLKLPLSIPLDQKSLSYHSPEVLNGEYDQKADVWAIGVLMFFVLCGDLPF